MWSSVTRLDGINRTGVRWMYRLGGQAAGEPAGGPTVWFIPVTPPLPITPVLCIQTTPLMYKARVREASQSKGWFCGPHIRLCIHKVVHTQGGAHTRRSVATAGVLLFKGGAGLAPVSSEAS